uniref:Ubiquitin-like protease family profile domain-containing protein n=1 Tax=Pelagomonas calceolata TaxID=35677 RepID=A0A7S4A074_9STRA
MADAADAAEAPPSKRQRLEAAFEAQGEEGRRKRQHLCCSMCLGPFDEPVFVKPLGNTYCKGCITAWLSENRTDPLTGTRLTVREGNIAAVLVPNIAVQQIIDAQSVPCRYAARGCEAWSALGDLEAHEANCPCKPSKCARCAFVGSRLEVAAHEQACPFVVLGPVLDAQNARIRNLEGEVRDAKRRLTAEHEATQRLKARLEALEAQRPGDLAVVSPPAARRTRATRAGPAETDPTPVFQYPPGVAASDSIVVTRGDLRRLEPGGYLNEKLVDFYLKVIVADARRSPLAEDPDFGNMASAVHAFPSDFFTMLSAGNERVERWTRGVDVFAKKFLLVPVVEDLHWSLAIVCHPGELAKRAIAGHIYPTVDSADHEDGPARPCVIHMDSRGSSLHSARKIEKWLRCFLEMEWRKRHAGEEPFTLWAGPRAGSAIMNPADLLLARPKVPQQMNSADSGLYALRYAQEFLTRAVCRGAPLAVNGRDVSLDFRDHDFEAWFTGRDIAEMRRDIKKLAADLELEKIRAAYRREQAEDAAARPPRRPRQ